MDAEQTQQPTTDTTAPDVIDDWAEPTDAELIDAVREAGGATSADVAAEAAAVGKPPPVLPPGETASDPDEPKIAVAIRAREKAFQERQDAQDYAATRRAQAEAEATKIIAEARAKAAADYDADLNARRAKFRETPGAAIRELGFTTEDIVDGVTREGTAEWRAIRAAEARAVAAEGKAGTVDAVKADFEAFKNSVIAEKQSEVRRQVEHHFLTEVASPEKAPYLHKRYDPEEILEKSHALANKWREAGQPFANSDVAEYLEHQARQRLAGTAVPPHQVSGGGSAQKVRANGSRTLSAASGSERRASPKPIDEMSDLEERDALIEAAREARRQNGG